MAANLKNEKFINISPKFEIFLRLTEKIGAVLAHHLQTQFVFTGLEAQGGDARRPAVQFRRI